MAIVLIRFQPQRGAVNKQMLGFAAVASHHHLFWPTPLRKRQYWRYSQKEVLRLRMEGLDQIILLVKKLLPQRTDYNNIYCLGSITSIRLYYSRPRPGDMRTLGALVLE